MYGFLAKTNRDTSKFAAELLWRNVVISVGDPDLDRTTARSQDFFHSKQVGGRCNGNFVLATSCVSLAPSSVVVQVDTFLQQ
jgi:hypothetical protein